MNKILISGSTVIPTETGSDVSVLGRSDINVHRCDHTPCLVKVSVLVESIQRVEKVCICIEIRKSHLYAIRIKIV